MSVETNVTNSELISQIVLRAHEQRTPFDLQSLLKTHLNSFQSRQQLLDLVLDRRAFGSLGGVRILSGVL